MSEIERVCRGRIFCSQLALWHASCKRITPMYSSRVKQTVSHTFRDSFIDNLFQYIPHGFTWPNAILTRRSLCQNLANSEITYLASCQFPAFSLHTGYPVQESFYINIPMLITARYMPKLVKKMKRSLDPPFRLLRSSCT